jgi:hypothetical protein
MKVILGSLDQVDWNALSHAYGPATNFPDVLRALAFGSNADRQKCLEEEWWGTVIHQGTYYSATEAVVPFLIEIALAPSTRAPHEVLEEIYGIAIGFVERKCRPPSRVLFAPFLESRPSPYDDMPFVSGAYDAVVGKLPELRDFLLNHRTDEASCIAMAFLFSTLVTHWQTALSVLLDALDRESRSVVRVATILAISDLLLSLAHYQPEDWRRACQAVAPRWAQILDEGESHPQEEIAAASLTLLESGAEVKRALALRLARELAFAHFELPGIRCRMRGGNFIWDFYEALWTNPTDQIDLIYGGLDPSQPDLLAESLYIAQRHCRRYRHGPSLLVPRIEALLKDGSCKAQHAIMATQLIELGEQGLDAARRVARNHPEAEKRLKSFEHTLSGFDCEAFPDGYAVGVPSESDLRIRECVQRLNDLSATPSSNMDLVRSAVKDRNPKIRSAGLLAFHRITGDHSGTVELILKGWEQDFIAVPLLRLLGECGAAAKHLVPEMESFIGSQQRYVDSGWLAGVCWLDEKMLAAAKQAVSKIPFES